VARILLVDDDEIVRSILRAFLRGSGHTLVEAVDGADGLEAQRLQAADVIITDQHMPRMSGCELAAAVRTEFPDTRILMISGLSMGNVDRRLVDGMLSKPFSRDELMGCLSRLLRQPAGIG